NIDRVQHEHACALRDRGVGLLLLLVRVLAGVLVEDLAVGAELLDLGLEERPVLLLIAGRLGLGQEEGDRLPAAASVPAATAASARRGVVVAPACREAERQDGRD